MSIAITGRPKTLDDLLRLKLNMVELVTGSDVLLLDHIIVIWKAQLVRANTNTELVLLETF